MSNENRDYPAWLDEELFAHLTEEKDSAAPQEAPAAPEQDAASVTGAPKKKKKPKTPDPADVSAFAAVLREADVPVLYQR